MHLARLRSDASGGSQLTVCQGLYPPEGWRVGKRTGMPQNEGRVVMEIVRTPSAPETLDTAVHVWIDVEEFKGSWRAGAGCHQ